MYRHYQVRLGISRFQNTQYTDTRNSSVRVNAGVNVSLSIHCESKKLGHFFTAYNLRNIEQIFTKFGRNHVLFLLNIMP